MTAFEDILENHIDPDAKRFFNAYSEMKDDLERNYYPWIQANCPYFTDHGQSHIASVMDKAYRILERRKMSTLTALDIYLILTAIIWHDVGMVLDRTNHQEAVHKIIEKFKSTCIFDVQILAIIEQIIKAHSGPSGLDYATDEVDCTTPAQTTITVSPRSLAAVLRFADEISETRSRINPELIDQVPLANRIYWEYSNCISASRPDMERERVLVTLNIDIDKAVTEFPCSDEERRNQNGNIALIEYIVLRLEKMNNERSYCIARSAGYVPMYKTIEAQMEWKRGEDALHDLDTTVFFSDMGLSQENDYPSIECFADFFTTNPMYRPEELRAL